MAGLLVNGEWKTKEQFADDDGQYKRNESQFRNWLTANGSEGPDGKKGFVAKENRYHLYVSYACPWAHRTLIFLNLKGLSEYIDVSVVHPYMGEKGWHFDADFKGATGDRLYGCSHMHELYTKAKSDYTGKVTVPVLWDKEEETIVSNESADIIRMLNNAFDEITGNTKDYYPDDLKSEIDDINNRVYGAINNGVYKAGFATDQDVYNKEVIKLFESLDWVESILSDQRQFLIGDHLTEADIRLLTTLLRFDAVYVTHFKCNLKMLSDYKHIQAYLERLYNMPEIKPTVHMDHIKTHYYTSHPSVNPSGIIPKGPVLGWLEN